MQNLPLKARWKQIIGGFEASRTTVRAYCDRHNISEPSFYSWRRRLAKQPQNTASRPVTFRLVEPPPTAPDHRTPAELLGPAPAPVDVILSNGATLRVACEERALRIVLAALS